MTNGRKRITREYRKASSAAAAAVSSASAFVGCETLILFIANDVLYTYDNCAHSKCSVHLCLNVAHFLEPSHPQRSLANCRSAERALLSRNERESLRINVQSRDYWAAAEARVSLLFMLGSHQRHENDTEHEFSISANLIGWLRSAFEFE